MAARVAAAGDAGQILVTAATMTAADGNYLASEPQSLALKGVAEPVDIVELSWR